jgi:hypothetical protein
MNESGKLGMEHWLERIAKLNDPESKEHKAREKYEKETNFAPGHVDANTKAIQDLTKAIIDAKPSYQQPQSYLSSITYKGRTLSKSFDINTDSAHPVGAN